MTTHSICTEIDIQENTQKLQLAIETELQKQGEPLRWAITSIDTVKQKVKVEAVVTRNSH